MTRHDFIVQALGADRNTVMHVVSGIVTAAGMSFTAEESRALWDMLLDPDSKMEVIEVLADAAQNSGLFE